MIDCLGRLSCQTKISGYSLPEMMMSVSIISVITIFSIPKVITAQQHNTYNTAAREAIGAISGAYQTYQVNNTVTSGTKIADFTPYLNYVALDTASSVDLEQTAATASCSDANMTCLKLHSGAMLWALNDNSFGGRSSTNAIYFWIDPDGGVTDGAANGPGKSVKIWLYANNGITSRGMTYANTVTNEGGSNNTYNADATLDPSWFSWG